MSKSEMSESEISESEISEQQARIDKSFLIVVVIRNIFAKTNPAVVNGLKEFHLFPKLPLELRLAIWKHCQPGPRKIFCYCTMSKNFRPHQSVREHRSHRSLCIHQNIEVSRSKIAKSKLMKRLSHYGQCYKQTRSPRILREKRIRLLLGKNTFRGRSWSLSCDPTMAHISISRKIL
jgi:hypothetical protein